MTTPHARWLVAFTVMATLTRVADGQAPYPPPPGPGANATDPNAPPAPPAALTIEEMKLRAAEKLLPIPRFTKGEEQCYFFLRDDPSVSPMEDRFFLLPPGRTWGNVPFSVGANFTDESFGTGGSSPTGSEELIVDFEVVFTPIGSKVTTADLYMTDEMGSVDAQMFRVLPSMGGDPTEVSQDIHAVHVDRQDGREIRRRRSHHAAKRRERQRGAQTGPTGNLHGPRHRVGLVQRHHAGEFIFISVRAM